MFLPCLSVTHTEPRHDAVLMCRSFVAAACTGPFTVANGTFPCNTIESALSCDGTCDNGYSGAPVASCAYGVYTVSGNCEPGKAPGGDICVSQSN